MTESLAVLGKVKTPAWPRPTLDWETRAKCRGVDDTGDDLFHPSIDEKTDQPSRTAAGAYERARQFCRRCPVTTDCLTAALHAETDSTRYGVWGGLSPRQRAAIEPGATRQDLAAAIRRALFPPQAAKGGTTPPASDRTDFTHDQMRAGNRAYDRWRSNGGPQPTPDEMAAYRAYQRWRSDERRNARRGLRERRAETMAARRAEIIRLREQGLTQRQIGDLIGLTNQAVVYHLRIAGISTRPRPIDCACGHRHVGRCIRTGCGCTTARDREQATA